MKKACLFFTVLLGASCASMENYRDSRGGNIETSEFSTLSTSRRIETQLFEFRSGIQLGEDGVEVSSISTNHMESGSASVLATTKYVEDKVNAKTFAIDYKGTDFGAASTNVVDFDVDIGTSGAFIPLVSIYTTHTNPANDSIEDVVVSAYIHPDRTGQAVQYRATMSFYSQALTNAAAVGTNTVYVADSSGFELNNFVVLDPGSHDNGMTQNRVAGVGTGYIVLETGLGTNYSSGVTISRGNQFGQLMYYDQTQSDTFYGRLVFTNAVTAGFKISLVTVD